MKRNNKNLIYSILLLILLSIGIGYAYLTSNLSITGATEIAANSWDIHFANLVVNSDSVEATTPASIDTNDDTSITYTVKLNRPKQFYEFTVDVVNEGSLPGKVSISSLSGITSEAENIVDYSVNYTNGNPVQVGDILNGGATKSIKVRVFYNDEIEADDLPSTNLNLTLTYTLQYVQSEKDLVDTETLINKLKTENTSCFTKYTGQVTDRVGQTVTASNVYFNKCADKRNIIFNNMCWQMIRTTENSGIKMIYNGDVVDGKCESTRGDHKGIVGATGSSETLNAEYLYGDSFTYDITNNTFTLTDTTTATWNDSTYENLLGKFTCKNTEGTCTTLYNVNGYSNSTTAYTSSYTIGDTNYAQIGTSAYNANENSPAMVGYMFNKVYNYKFGSPTSGSLMGNDVSYSNGTYTLLPADGESELGTTLDNTHHYTCNNTTGTCSKVRYYYYNKYYHIELDGAENIQAAVNEMLYNNEVNRYNSSIKGIIDAWYRQNLLSKTNMLEDTVYCNARVMSNQASNGWNKDGSLTTTMQFKNYSNSYSNDLSCANVTDQFAVGNNKAKLTYPVALLENEERYNIDTPSLMSTGASWWTLSPLDVSTVDAYVRLVNTAGSYGESYVNNAYGLRFVVSLSTGAVITGGDGSKESPWVVE